MNEPRKRFRLREQLRNYFLAGVLITGPAALTFYLVWIFIRAVDRAVTALLPDQYNPATYLPFNVPGLGLIVAVVGLTLIGALTANVLGRFFLRIGDRILTRMPFIRGVYSAVKQIFETVLAKQSNTFREVVLVEFPRPNTWTLAFVTARPEGELKELVPAGSIGIYVPTTPNPTSGYLVYVPRKDVKPVDMTVEEAIKFIVSGGIVTPPERRTGAQPERK